MASAALKEPRMALVLKKVKASHGLRWIGDALRLFARKPIGFTALFALFLVAALGLSLVPVLGGVVQMMTLPLLSLGFMVAAQSVLLNGPALPRHFIEPLQGHPLRRRGLLILCGLYGLLAIGILLLANSVSSDAWLRMQALMAKGATAQADIDALLSEAGLRDGVVTALVLGGLMSVPFWHAPALVHWGGQSWGQALFSSTLAIWRNKGAFFVYALGWVGLVLGFALVFGLVLSLLGLQAASNVLAVPGGLVVSAVFYISLLFCFNDCFGGQVAPPFEAPESADLPPPPPPLPPPALPPSH
jgi:hypothetical protein